MPLFIVMSLLLSGEKRTIKPPYDHWNGAGDGVCMATSSPVGNRKKTDLLINAKSHHRPAVGREIESAARKICSDHCGRRQQVSRNGLSNVHAWTVHLGDRTGSPC